MMKMLNMMNMYPNFFGKIHPQHAVFMRPSDPGCTEQSIAQAPTPGPELPWNDDKKTLGSAVLSRCSASAAAGGRGGDPQELWRWVGAQQDRPLEAWNSDVGRGESHVGTNQKRREQVKCLIILGRSWLFGIFLFLGGFARMIDFSCSRKWSENMRWKTWVTTRLPLEERERYYMEALPDDGSGGRGTSWLPSPWILGLQRNQGIWKKLGVNFNQQNVAKDAGRMNWGITCSGIVHS